MKVLIAEDDEHIRQGLVDILEGEGYSTIAVADGPGALAAFERERPDFVCLDIMMPGEDGYEVCRRLRALSPATPIIFISAKGEEVDKVVGLELGADDFIMKPFGVREVVARIRAVARRCRRSAGLDADHAPFRMAELEVAPVELRARRGDQTIELSPRDVMILQSLYRHRGQPVDRDTLFKECWAVDHVPNSRTLDQHISQLRKRIEGDPRHPAIIRTVHGVGYRYDG